ncbi:MAG: threonine aldolase family protein [Flammeovirgaceae bacterium]
MKQQHQRRDFLKKFGLASMPLLLPNVAAATIPNQGKKASTQPLVNFIYDGFFFEPNEYLKKLHEINEAKTIEPDFYGVGGATTALEERFKELTGKEKAIYLPTGTMANQLAIKLLSGNKTKVLAPENSHVFRDEADAAQSVHGKRLIPVGKGKAHFELADLKNTIAYLHQGEVFRSGLGAVVIENPVRRADGRFVPRETIKKIATYCKQNGYGLHLDGARLHLAAAYSGVSVKEYASYFDTVYISLYKYLHAAGGAILCGETKLIDQIAHQIKILGGTTFQTWTNTSVALHYLEGIESRWEKVKKNATQLIESLNKLKGVSIETLENGSNRYHMRLDEAINFKKLATYLSNTHQIWIGGPNEDGIIRFTVNESLLTRPLKNIMTAWKQGVSAARS